MGLTVPVAVGYSLKSPNPHVPAMDIVLPLASEQLPVRGLWSVRSPLLLA